MAGSFRSLSHAVLLLVTGACAMPPRVLPPSTQPVVGAYRFWTCDQPCAFTEEPTKETRLTTLVLFEAPPEPGSQGRGTASACWLGDLPAGVAQEPGAGARTGTWRLDADGVIRLVLAAAAGAGSVLHISVQGEALTGSIETWSCKDGCKQAWYAVDGVRIGKPTRERCGL